MNTTKKHEQIWESLHDPDFRKQLIDEHINVGIAFQIRSLRNRQELTQTGLAKLLDVKQPLLSSWENPNYGRYTLKTLRALAKAFDVGLLVRFVPFSKLVDWTVDLTSDVIAPPSFDEEQDYAYALKQIAEALKSANDIKGIGRNHTGIPEPIEPVKEPVPSTASVGGVLT
ncbi:MAG: helix-turn-helix transcriptional regulator [Deltaproteobacteria bacterium]|nr:helix-turn-helix transcriptional regulator [Deltaproteobacteria bacterium]